MVEHEHERHICRAHAFLTKCKCRAPGETYSFSATAKVIKPIDTREPGEIRVDMKGVHESIDFLDTAITVDTHGVTMTEATTHIGRKMKNGLRRIRFSTTTGEFIHRGTLVPASPL